MPENNDKENLCSKRNDVIMYAFMSRLVKVNEEKPCGLFDDFINKGYGKTLKEVDQYFSKHFQECFSCKENYLLITASDERDKDRITQNSFEIEHINLGEESEALFKYISHRNARLVEGVLTVNPENEPVILRPERIKINKKYEEHIKVCDTCKKYRTQSRESARNMRKIWENPDKFPEEHE